MYYSHTNKNRRVIDNNHYDFEKEEPRFTPAMVFKPFYQKSLSYLLARDKINCNVYSGKQQKNYYSQCPYEPIRLDARYGRSRTDLSELSGFDKSETGNSNVCGRDSLDPEHSTTAILGKMVLKALDRLSGNADQHPFSLSIHFNAPHPPMVAIGKFMDFYYQQRNRLFVAPSVHDKMENSPYQGEKSRKRLAKIQKAITRKSQIAELTAVYYGLVEEVDSWIGRILDRLDMHGQTNNTLIVLTSDHGTCIVMNLDFFAKKTNLIAFLLFSLRLWKNRPGEMLGAHALMGKGVLLEEATRVPLILSFPGRIPMNTTVKSAVSQMDIFSTIFDYLGYPNLDRSDGLSLRRYIDRTSYNRNYDERAVVSELDNRIPKGPNALVGTLGDIPNLMIRKGRYVFILPKNAKSPVADVLYDLVSYTYVIIQHIIQNNSLVSYTSSPLRTFPLQYSDPFQTRNLLGNKGMTASDTVINKAEYMRVLLLEWMQRHDHNGYYSDSKYNNNEGRGDIAEIRSRRTWRRVKYWQSHQALQFGIPVVNEEGLHARNEYLYLGCSLGTLKINEISLGGADAKYFEISHTRALIKQNGYLRLKVQFRSTDYVEIDSLDAHIRLNNNVNGVKQIPIIGKKQEDVEG